MIKSFVGALPAGRASQESGWQGCCRDPRPHQQDPGLRPGLSHAHGHAGGVTFARERVQEGPGSCHLAVVARGPRGVAQAAHGARGILGAALVSAWVPTPPQATCPRPPCGQDLTFGSPSISPEPAGKDTRLRSCARSSGAGYPRGFRSCNLGAMEVAGAAPRGHPRVWGQRSLRVASFSWRGDQGTSQCRRWQPGNLIGSRPGAWGSWCPPMKPVGGAQPLTQGSVHVVRLHRAH